jgi:hypothetical protein
MCRHGASSNVEVQKHMTNSCINITSHEHTRTHSWMFSRCFACLVRKEQNSSSWNLDLDVLEATQHSRPKIRKRAHPHCRFVTVPTFTKDYITATATNLILCVCERNSIMKNAYGWVLQRLNGDKNAFAIEYVPVKSSTNKRISTKMECARDDHPAKDAESVGKELEPANRFKCVRCNRPLLPLRVCISAWNRERKIALENLAAAVEND